MIIKPKLIQYYSDVARRTSKLSYARRLKVGSIVVQDNKIISFGYNGTPVGEDNNCEDEIDGQLVTKPSVIHAEANALRKLEGEDLTSSSIFITLSPCKECAELIINANIKHVYYEEVYRSIDGLKLLESRGVICQQVSSSYV